MRNTILLAVLALGITLQAAPASADENDYDPNVTWGAISYSPSNNQLSWTWGQQTQALARIHATTQCNNYDCVVLAYEANSYAAVAQGQGGVWAANGSDLPSVEADALNQCSARYGRCHIAAWISA
jgi:hypothetical protein